MENILLASMMVCNKPVYLNGRYIISAYDGVWDAVEELPDDIKSYFTSDIGDKVTGYGGFLQVINPQVLDILNERGLFTCFRGVEEKYLEFTNTVPPEKLYDRLFSQLRFVGWDICIGNGWRSASTDGYFPIDPFTGVAKDKNINQINRYGLFENLENCLNYCKLNNEKVPMDSPWYPVAVYLDQNSYNQLI